MSMLVGAKESQLSRQSTVTTTTLGSNHGTRLPSDLPPRVTMLEVNRHHVNDAPQDSGPSFRSRLAIFFEHNRTFHFCTFILLICDVVVVLSEIVWDLDVLGKNECLRDRDCPTLRRVPNGTNFISDGSTCLYNTTFVFCKFSDGALRCLPEEGVADFNPVKVFHAIGLGILIFFTIEIFIKACALGATFFDTNNRKLELFDAFVVVTSLLLDLVFSYSPAANTFQTGQTGAELIIVLRLWRFARILNGSVVATDLHESGKRKEALGLCVKCEVTTVELRRSYEATLGENAKLREENSRLLAQRRVSGQESSITLLDPSPGGATSGDLELPAYRDSYSGNQIRVASGAVRNTEEHTGRLRPAKC